MGLRRGSGDRSGGGGGVVVVFVVGDDGHGVVSLLVLPAMVVAAVGVAD